MTVRVGATWRQRGVLWMLVRRDLAVKYQSSALGYLWSVIDPLVQALIYWFIFGVIYQTKAVEIHSGYALYIVSGIFAWMWMSAGISQSAHALTSQSRLITTMRVRREIFPVAKVFARSMEYLVGIPIVAIFAVFFDGAFTWRLALIPVGMLIQGVLLVGIALLLAPLNVLFRDIERMTRLVTRMLMYSAPIIYPLSRIFGIPGHPDTAKVPQWFQVIYECNPLVGIIELNHGMWIPELLPSAHVMLTSALGAVIVFLVGFWTFRRCESSVLKEL